MRLIPTSLENPAMATLLDSAISSARKHLQPLTNKMYDQKQLPWLDTIMAKLEELTGVRRENLTYGTIAFLTVYLLVGSVVQLVSNIVGFVYPAWCSIKAVRSRTKDDDTQWLIYWIVFAFFSVLDFSMFSALPFYWLGKIIFLMYLQLPSFKGANTIYVNYVDPLCTVLEGYFTPKEKSN